MRIKEIMSPEVECLDPTATILDAAQIMRECNVGSLPVMAGDRLVGILTDRDIVCRLVAEGLDGETTLVDTIMTREVATCLDNDDVEVAIHLMEDRKIRRLAVLDHDTSRMIGMLSLGDLSATLPHDIAGEVMDRVSVHH
ncbi:MAG: CBS domain-containing protein [Magnetospirillum sp. WYHS-4]